jgi:hypothetical protein
MDSGAIFQNEIDKAEGRGIAGEERPVRVIRADTERQPRQLRVIAPIRPVERHLRLIVNRQVRVVSRVHARGEIHRRSVNSKCNIIAPFLALDRVAGIRHA